MEFGLTSMIPLPRPCVEASVTLWHGVGPYLMNECGLQAPLRGIHAMANGFKKNGSQMYRAHAIEAPNKTSFQNAPLKNILDKTVGLRPAFCALSALLAEVLREGSIFQYFFVFTVGSLELIQGPGHWESKVVMSLVHVANQLGLVPSLLQLLNSKPVGTCLSSSAPHHAGRKGDIGMVRRTSRQVSVLSSCN